MFPSAFPLRLTKIDLPNRFAAKVAVTKQGFSSSVHTLYKNNIGGKKLEGGGFQLT